MGKVIGVMGWVLFNSIVILIIGRLGLVIHKSLSHGLGNGPHGLGNGPRGLGNGRILNIVKVEIFGCWVTFCWVTFCSG